MIDIAGFLRLAGALQVVSEIEPFRAIAISRLAHALKAEGRSVIHMEFGQPSTGAPPAAIAEAHRVLDADAMGYWESAPLKARIARLYQDRYGVTVIAGPAAADHAGLAGPGAGPVVAVRARATGSPWPGRAMSPIAIR